MDEAFLLNQAWLVCKKPLFPVIDVLLVFVAVNFGPTGPTEVPLNRFGLCPEQCIAVDHERFLPFGQLCPYIVIYALTQSTDWTCPPTPK